MPNERFMRHYYGASGFIEKRDPNTLREQMREIVPICGIGLRCENGNAVVYIESPDGTYHDVLSGGLDPAAFSGFLHVEGIRNIIEGRHGVQAV